MQKANSILSMTLVLVMILALAACGGPTESSAPESTAPESTAPESEAPEASGWVPTQQVEMILPFAAGGSSDVMARAMEAVWSTYCDQPLVLTNIPGGGGVPGALADASAAPAAATT